MKYPPHALEPPHTSRRCRFEYVRFYLWVDKNAKITNTEELCVFRWASHWTISPRGLLTTPFRHER
jgi:hypothetical protein